MELLGKMGGPVQGQSMQIIYFLQKWFCVPSLCAPALLVLSEFCRIHQETTPKCISIFLANISQPITFSSKPSIEASLLSLRTLSGILLFYS